MNWDLVIGLIIGLSGSVLGLIGTIVTNRQNHEKEIELANLNHKHELEVSKLSEEFERKASLQQIALENSFKEYEFRHELGVKLSEIHGTEVKSYPYDMFLIIYQKIAEYLNGDNPQTSLSILLSELEEIRAEYDYSNHYSNKK